MDLDSIYRFIQETHIFGTQPSAGKAPGDGDAGAPGAAPRDPCRSRRPPGGLQPHAAPSARARAAEWDICAELRLRELEAAQARAAQLEQTMRWWSDCTATWREKWSKARAERNRAREEGRQLRLQLERTAKELSALKQQRSRAPGKEALEAGEAQARARPGFPAASRGPGDPAQIGSQACESIRECLVKRESPTKENTPSVEEGLILHPLGLSEEAERCPNRLDALEKGSSKNWAVKPGLGQKPGHLPLQNEAPKISALQVHLDEFQKILRQERDMRSSLEREIERLQSAVSSWKQKYEELNASMSKTRRELERLQVENASERDQREILETEKQELERENRSLKAQVKEMDELLKAKNRLNASSQGPDFKTSNIELQENHQELLALQHARRRLSGRHQATAAELTHASHRADRNVAEAKTLWSRVEGLRQRLHQKPEQLADSLSQTQKLQRSLGEQKDAKENVGTELRQNRLVWGNGGHRPPKIPDTDDDHGDETVILRSLKVE